MVATVGFLPLAALARLGCIVALRRSIHSLLRLLALARPFCRKRYSIVCDRTNPTSYARRSAIADCEFKSHLRNQRKKAPCWVPFCVVLYSQFRCHSEKVNKIKGFRLSEAISCASKIDAYCSRTLLTHSINSFSSLIFDINNTAHTTEIKINASIS